MGILRLHWEKENVGMPTNIKRHINNKLMDNTEKTCKHIYPMILCEPKPTYWPAKIREVD